MTPTAGRSSPDWAPMNAPRIITVALACLCVAGSACTATQSSAAEVGAPPSTIGLGFEFETEPGLVRGGADVRAIDGDEIEAIVMLGDSITVASRPALADRFQQLGYDDVLIEAETGKRMTVTDGSNASGLSLISYLAAADEDGDHSDELWIVALGTNDINQYGSVEQIAAEVDAMIDAIPAEAALVWVDTYYRQESDGAARVNAVISDRLAARGNSVVAPWSLFAEDAISVDGLHPSQAGRDVFADVVAGVVVGFVDG
jgi:lysophospholipase L1-like esterase